MKTLLYLRRRRRGAKGAPQAPLLISAALLLLLFSFIPLLGLGGVVGVYAYYAKDLVPPETMALREVSRSTKIFDRHGELLFEVFDPRGGRRTTVPLPQIPLALREATIATEDANFYANPGFDLRGIFRALIQNLRGEGRIQGGSSITQQLVKNVLIPEQERTQISLARKIKEVILAYELTRRYSKEQILEWYLNEVYYGNISYGVEAAAEGYFGKRVSELSLAEAAMLAGLPQAPALYSPLVNTEAAKARQGVVLDLMVRQGFITAREAEEAKGEELVFATQRFPIRAPHFVMYVRELLERKYGADALYKGGLRVTTSLDLGMQEQGEWIVREQVEKLRAQNAHNAALVAIKPETGEILAMVGSVDYFDTEISGQVNMAMAERQPGSSFKPFTYLTTFMKGYTPATMLLDVRTSFPDGVNPPYVPENVDGKFRGPLSVREALAQSVNIPAVRALQYAGLKDVLDTAHRMGITTLTRKNFYGLSLTLGGGEVKLLDMVYAYSVMANGGMMAGTPVPTEERKAGMRTLEPVAILKVEDGQGRVLEEFKGPATQPVLSPQLAYLMTDILSDNNARAPLFGPRSALVLTGKPAAVKTGTTNDWRDTWTIGYTPDLAAGVWVGNADNTPMRKVLSMLTAAPIWHDFMEAVLGDQLAKTFQEPEGLVRARVCSISGQLPTSYCPETREELFLKGSVPKESCTVHQPFRIDRRTGRLATAQTPPSEVEERVFLILPPDAADWVRERGIPQPPRDYSLAYDGDAIITSPQPGAYVRGKVGMQGSAKGSGFVSYRLEFGEGLSPATWRPVGSAEGRVVEGGELGVWDTIGLNGLYTLRLRVQTQGGGNKEVAIPITVDNLAPRVRIAYPYPGGTLVYEREKSEVVGVQAEAQDNHGVERVEFYLDGASLGFTRVSPYNVEWRLALGEHTLYAVVFDEAGNSSQSEAITFKVISRS